MSKLLKFITEQNEIDENKNLEDNTVNDLLMKTKLFLKITRLVIENTKISIYKKNGKIAEFFSMYIFF